MSLALERGHPPVKGRRGSQVNWNTPSPKWPPQILLGVGGIEKNKEIRRERRQR